MNTPYDLPPWLSSPYFTAPSVTQITSLTTSSIAQIAPADPTRVLLLICGDPKGTTISVGPTNKLLVSTNVYGIAMGGSGTGVPSALPYLLITPATFGPLVGAAWYGVAVGSGSSPFILVVSVSSLNWDVSDAGKGRLDTVDPGPIRPPARIDSGPGVNGKRGILDYWYRLVSRMTGGGKV